MILYLDTSCWAKIYILEPGSDLVRRRLSEADAVASSMVSYPELRSALARRQRDGDIPKKAYGAVLRRIESDWARLLRLPVTESVADAAGALAERHGLRGLDAIQLSSALSIKAACGPEEVAFYCADAKLCHAGRETGFRDLYPIPS